MTSYNTSFFKKNVSGTLVRFLIFFLFFISGFFIIRIYFYSPKENPYVYTNNNFYFLGVNIPSDLHFCGERIPSNSYEIKKNLEKEFFNNTYWKANSAVLFAKAQKWFPYIEPILKKEGVPDDFKYVAVIESHLSNIVSPAGAAGFWQLVPVSARNYNLEVNQYVDERYHVEKATVAACKLFKEAHGVFKNWTLAAAAYNLGIGGIQYELEKQKAKTYYDLMLNRETGSFVYRILAYKTLFSSPGHFGIKKKKWSYYPKIPMKTIKVDSSVTNLANLAKHVNCSKSIIKFFNPWILGESLPNPDKRLYEIRIPSNPKADYSTYIRDLVGQDGDLSQEVDSPPVKVMPENSDTSNVYKNQVLHVVRDKESLKELAEFYDVKEEDIRKWNKIKEKQEAVTGQTLVIQYK